jgi:hypothetical protein
LHKSIGRIGEREKYTRGRRKNKQEKEKDRETDRSRGRSKNKQEQEKARETDKKVEEEERINRSKRRIGDRDK